jgi:hypothetical protein
LYGVFVWAREVLNSEKRRFLARAGEKPSLGIASAPGPGGAASTANNIVLNNAALGNGVFYDTHARLFRQFVPPLIRFIPDPLRYSVLVRLFLKRQCGRTL